MKPTLDSFQREVLEAFFRRERGFFLTGGGALAGFHQPEKPELLGIRVDPPQEILANKLCTALSRGEIRDLVDLRALEQAGYRIEDLIDRAALKDGGLTPAQLAWVLSQIEIGDDARLPGGVSVPELRSYLVDLQDRLTRMALPAQD